MVSSKSQSRSHCNLEDIYPNDPFQLKKKKSNLEAVVDINGGEKNISQIWNETEYVAFYFSADWCPPCKRFTPQLAKFYAEVNRKQQDAEQKNQPPQTKVTAEDLILKKMKEIEENDAKATIPEEDDDDDEDCRIEDLDKEEEKKKKKEEDKKIPINDTTKSVAKIDHDHDDDDDKKKSLAEKKSKKLEILFVSIDDNVKTFAKYFSSHMLWYSIPFTQKDWRAHLQRIFDVSSMPTLIIVETSTGEITTKEGHVAMLSEPEQFPWKNYSQSFWNKLKPNMKNQLPLLIVMFLMILRVILKRFNLF